MIRDVVDHGGLHILMLKWFFFSEFVKNIIIYKL